mmetsp:Transcript_46346/g.114934  ORF Transcript_46346/g.114934 Transcript_46346/m.114934 type:complete len:252 (-) Transcript_46346:413-1168(-)
MVQRDCRSSRVLRRRRHLSRPHLRRRVIGEAAAHLAEAILRDSDRVRVEQDGFRLRGHVAHVVPHDERRSGDRPDRHLRALLVERDARGAISLTSADQQHVHIMPVATERAIRAGPRLQGFAVVAPVLDDVGKALPAALDVLVIAPQVAPVIDIRLEWLGGLVLPRVCRPTAAVHNLPPTPLERTAHRGVAVLVVRGRTAPVDFHVVDAPLRKRLRVDLLMVCRGWVASASRRRLSGVRREREVARVEVAA